MKRILINANNPSEIRVALLHDNNLFDLNIQTLGSLTKRSNIYKGIISRVEASLDAAFIDYGQDRHGFLPFKEINKGCFASPDDTELPVAEQIKVGQQLIVQVDKEERGNKGASLTTNISLAGTFLVLFPVTEEKSGDRSSGISQSLNSTQRQSMREMIEQLTIPSGFRVILRTSGANRSVEELQWNLDYMLKLWEIIQKVASEKKEPLLIHQEGGLVERTIRDYFNANVEEIIIDDDDTFEHITNLVKDTIPGFIPMLKKHTGPGQLFHHFDIESQIEAAYLRNVRLPSGGELVFDTTEALISIDVNSARATQGDGIEETALQTNLEAADEIARQFRLRDLGGLVVIDFIDMSDTSSKRKLESHFEEAL